MLEIRNLKTMYGGKEVLRLESLDAAPGQITTILGRNGSGKSTLLRSTGAIIPCSGIVRADGEDLQSITRREKARRIAYLPQTLAIPEMTVYTLVSHGRFCRLGFSKRLGSTDRQIIARAMEETDVWELRDRMVKELSGGERQRAYLAMVIAQEAGYLLLDEPAASMDIAHQLELAGLLRKLADQGKGILTASHDLPWSFAFSDRIVLLDGGQKLAEGTPEEMAGEKDRMRQAMGAFLVSAESNEGFFPYVIAQ